MIAALAAVLVGGALLLAGSSKLAAPQAWRRQATEFGVPVALVRILPWVEVGLGAVLITQIARTWSAALAGLVLLAFTAALVRRLVAGRRPPCACFGTRSSRPISWWTVARNLLLVALAAVAALA